MPRFEAATPSPDPSFLDMIDEPGPNSGELNIVARGGGRVNDWASSFSGPILNTSDGSPNTTELFNRQWDGALTVAGVLYRGGRIAGLLNRMPWWPIGLSWTGFPASAVFNMRYRWTLAMQADVPVVGDGLFGTGINYTTTAERLVSRDAGSVGVEVSSQPSVNAGRWTAWWRTTSAGALGSQDLGVAVDGTFQQVGFQYDTGPSRITFLVEGNPVYVLPVAQTPDQTSVAGAYTMRMGAFVYSGGVANQQYRWGQGRMTISKVS
jgi:hypothetical protein